MNLKYPRWQQAVEAAILEFDPTALKIKLQDAETAISKRLVELTSEKKSEYELQALSDACSTGATGTGALGNDGYSFFPAGSWSIDADAGTCRCSLDLL